ncbi:MAG: hypothetical protein CME64_00600 [Halobacteriovoraceae bacterium]|nr:hypothetical protein [Halobacteriovoraceae bacterium]|tara:strand:+ start:138346 stop:138531 length:186 start_codon:yes stop_codon:yes gene_type:complete
MKSTESSSLLKGNQKQTTFAKTARPTSLRSARPMKSMMKLKSARPKKVEVTKKLMAKAIKV